MKPSIPSPSRRVWGLLLTLLLIVAIALLRPQTQAWLNDQIPRAESSARINLADAAARAETSPPELSKPEQATGHTEFAQATIATAARSETADVAQNDTATAPYRNASPAASDSRESGDEPLPGNLKLVGKNVFRSTAGLIYRPGSQDGHRLKHILKHAKDDLSKPVHGVFSGDRDAILRQIDVAWLEVKKGGKNVRQRTENRRTAWTVRLREKVGYVGGRKGRDRNHPECRYLRLVIESDGTTVVTAYPVAAF